MFKKLYYIIICFLLFISLLFSIIESNAKSCLYFPLRDNYIQTSNFGYRKLVNYHFHGGIDLAAPVGTPVYAVSPGTVIYSNFYSTYGNCIIISYYNGYKSIYGHLDSNYKVKVGDIVTALTIVGKIGPKYLSNGKLNGMTTGPHLHFALYKKGKLINPSSVNFTK